MKNFIKKLFREKLITEVEGVKYDYGCVMLYFNIPQNIWNKVQSMVSDDDITNVGDAEGRETNPHVTILYGLHSDIPDEKIEELVKEMNAPTITLKNISTFNNAEFDVVKFDVESEDLFRMNKLFTQLPHTTNYPDYHPHATIAYVKPGEGDKYKGSLDKPIVVVPDKVVYSKADGSKINYKFK